MKLESEQDELRGRIAAESDRVERLKREDSEFAELKPQRDELLAKIDGMNAQVAKESIERYNQLAKAGSDEDFGKSSQRMFALENGPFYAAECGVALTLANLGGLESDSDCHVYNTEREVISGLYVAGAPQGGRFNVQYPISLKGLSAGMCMVFGKIAGENAAAGK